MLNRRQGLQAAAALAGLMIAGRARADVPSVVSLSEQRNRFLAAVEVNAGSGFRFVIDTGASAHFISTRLVEQLQLPHVEERYVRGFDGRNRESVIGIARLSVGGMDLGKARAIAWSPERLEQHDGLIGYPFLYPRAVISLAGGRISFGEADPAAMIPVRAEVTRQQALLLGGLSGTDGRFVFDTGAQSFTIAPAYHDRIADSEAFKAAVKLVYRKADGETRTAAFRPALMRFGDFSIPDPIIRIGPADGREGVFHGVDGLFGVNLLRPYTWLIDQAAGGLKVAGEAPAQLGYYGSGMQIETRRGAAQVVAVQDGGPAFEAGIRPGQMVRSIGGEPPARWSPRRLAAMTPNDRPGRQTIELVDRGERRTASFETRRLL